MNSLNSTLKLVTCTAAAVVAAQSATAAPWIARHGLDATQYQDFYDNELPNGYRLFSVDVNGPANDPNFAGVWIADEFSDPGEWDAIHGYTSDQYQQYASDRDAEGYRVSAVAAYGVYPNEVYAAAFVKDGTPDTDWGARHRMTEAQLNQESTDMVNLGLTMEFISAVGSGNDTRYSAVWRKNYTGWSKWVRWDMSAAEYQQEVEDRMGAGYRPMHLDVSGTDGNPRFHAIFVRPDGNQWEHQPHWVARHAQSGVQHQDLMTDLENTDMQPLAAIEYGDSTNPTFGSIWVKIHDTPSFTETGVDVPALITFDQAMKDFMVSRKIRNGQLAVTYQGRLVLNRGYTYAPSNWPTTQIDDMFRTASISKLYTAVAIFQLIEANTPTLNGPLTLESTLADLGGNVGTGWTNANVPTIKIKELLQHIAGWENDSDDLAGAFDPMFSDFTIESEAGIDLPTTPQIVLDWMKGKPLNYTPGTVYAYSNFGYSLLGRVIEQLSGQTYEEYVNENILCPIGAADMFIGQTLVENTDVREVPYVDPMRRFRTSRMGDDNLVLVQYGGFNVQTFDAHGAWTATAEDLARFANAFSDKANSPLLSEANIDDMWDPSPLNNGKSNGWSLGTNQQFHNGSIPGTWSYLITRNDEVTISVLFNQRSADTTTPVTDDDWMIRSNLNDAADDIMNAPPIGGAPPWPTNDLWGPGEYCSAPNIYDFNRDGFTDGADLAQLLTKWGRCEGTAACPEDTNGDGVVDGSELAGLLAEWNGR